MPRVQEAPAEKITDYVKRGRRFPVGAEVMDGQINFCVWAPAGENVELVLERPEPQEIPMSAEDQGYFSAIVPDPGTPVFYRFRLQEQGVLLPDPASRFQPEGPHGPSQVIDPRRFAWTDQDWPGVDLEGRIVYEMHVGTFTPQGDWLSASRRLGDLVAAGIGMVEVMPVADFPGRFGWGYDGVDLFAPTRLYGQPDELRHFINQAHELNLGVILDVVYNHFGPDGSYLQAFSPAYFTDRHECDWGAAINFEGADARPVRDFFISNACYWIEEFHFDGFRLDATQQIFDDSQPHIIAEIVENARRSAGSRKIVIIAENETQRTELLLRVEQGGAGVDALWNDDFHHTMLVALTGKKEAYYSDYGGSPQEIVSTARHGFLYQGQLSRWQNQPRGTPSLEIDHARFVCYLENHDQVANSAWGNRLGQIVSPGAHRAATALLLLGPWTPLVFQGQEFASSRPFCFFADHKPEMAQAIADGRREFLSQFPSLAHEPMRQLLAAPGREETFQKCRLDFRERQTNSHFYRMFQDLARLRRTDEVFSLQGQGGVEGAVLSDHAFVLRFFGRDSDRLLIVNFGADLLFTPAPEPLLAPPQGHQWQMVFSTENPHYGGAGIAEVRLKEGWQLPAWAALAFVSRRRGADDGRADSQDTA